MGEELRFALRCFGSSKKPVKKKKKSNKNMDLNPLDGPNGTLTPLTSAYTSTNANHIKQYGIPDQYT